MISREDFKKQVFSLDGIKHERLGFTDSMFLYRPEVMKVIDNLYDSIESDNSCNGCKHEPKKGDPYPTPCGECSRWWSDSYEAKGVSDG